MPTQSKGRRIGYWLLAALITLMFVSSSIFKLVRAPQIVEVFGKWGLAEHTIMIGIGELISALLFIIPKTHSLGLLLLTAYLGGAIVTHMQHSEPYILPSILLLLVWVAGYLRHPELLQSFRK